jgi:serine/threonine protein kinase
MATQLLRHESNQHIVSPKNDSWALGMTLYSLITKKRILPLNRTSSTECYRIIANAKQEEIDAKIDSLETVPNLALQLGKRAAARAVSPTPEFQTQAGLLELNRLKSLLKSLLQIDVTRRLLPDEALNIYYLAESKVPDAAVAEHFDVPDDLEEAYWDEGFSTSLVRQIALSDRVALIQRTYRAYLSKRVH